MKPPMGRFRFLNRSTGCSQKDLSVGSAPDSGVPLTGKGDEPVHSVLRKAGYC